MAFVYYFILLSATQILLLPTQNSITWIHIVPYLLHFLTFLLLSGVPDRGLQTFLLNITELVYCYSLSTMNISLYAVFVIFLIKVFFFDKLTYGLSRRYTDDCLVFGEGFFFILLLFSLWN